MQCPHCHGQIPDGLQVCFLCGQSVSAPAAPVPTVPAASAQIPQGFAPDPSGSGKYYSSEYLWENGVYVRRITWFDPATGSLTPYDYPEQPPAAAPAPGPAMPARSEASVGAPSSMGPAAPNSAAHMPPPNYAGAGGKPGGKSGGKAKIIIPIVAVLVLLGAAVGGHFLGLYQLPLLPAVSGSAVSGSGGATGSLSGASTAPAPSVLPDTPIVWRDSFIENLVRRHLGKPEGDIVPSELRDVRIISISGGNGQINKVLDERQNDNNGTIESIEDLRYFTSLEILEIMYQQFSDISPVAGLTALTQLNFHNNNISDISPVAGLTNLVEIKFGSNNIADLSPLSGLPRLEKLYLHTNAYKSIDALAPLVSLTTLVVSDNDISDINAVANMPKLDFLNASGTNVTDLSPAAHVREVEHSVRSQEVQDRQDQAAADDRATQSTHNVFDNTGFTLGGYHDVDGSPEYFASGKWVRDDGRSVIYIHGNRGSELIYTIYTMSYYGDQTALHIEDGAYLNDEVTAEGYNAYCLTWVDDGVLLLEDTEKSRMIWEEMGVASPEGLYLFSQARSR